jgi:glycosyltransferase involved in cell wall biosynthesis
VLLDATYAARAPHSGTAIYTERLLAAISAQPDAEVQSVANASRRAPAGGGAGSVRNLLAEAYWAAVELPRLAREAGADVIHHTLPSRAITHGLAQVITVHDLAFERLPQLFDRGYRTFAHHAHRAAARRADAVICVSETTAADVRELWGVPEQRIVVARHGPGQLLHAGGERAARHFLYVGDDEPRKDLATLLAAYARYRKLVAGGALDLVLAGSAAGSAAGVRTEPNPTPERLGELHATAAALVHPSLYEGFGLTVLEAMAAGTPVLAARAPGTSEVCGDAALYFAPGNARELADRLAELAADPKKRADLAVRGLAQATKFSWAACARAHVDAYSLAMQVAGG